MAIGVVGTPFSAGEDGNGGGTLDVAGTVDAATNLGLLFSYLAAGPGETLAATIQPGAGTAIVDDNEHQGRTAESAYRTSPSTGSQTQVVTYSNPGAQRVVFGAFVGIGDADISGDPIRSTSAVVEGTDGSPSINVSGTDGDLAIAAVFVEENRSVTVSAGSEVLNDGFTIATFANDNNEAACRVVIASAPIVGGTATITFSIAVGTGRDWQLHGFSVKAQAASSGGERQLTRGINRGIGRGLLS